MDLRPVLFALPFLISAPTSAHEPGEEFQDCETCPTMIVVPAGTFTMGSPQDEAGRWEDEGPQHDVTFARPFAVGKFEVTFDEWDACVADGGCDGHVPADQGWGRGTRPVIEVNWDDTRTYLKWLSAKTGKTYRLLSEAEWEYVARADTTTPFPWGTEASHEYANYGKDECCGGLTKENDQWEFTAPVGSFPANAFGLHDMHGNVWEWVEDCWRATYDNAPNDGASWRESDCKRFQMRGGSWNDGPRSLRSAKRYWSDNTIRSYFDGFRVARELD